MKTKNERIGIFGGTFDPIHLGHLITAEDVRQKLGLDRIIFIPSGSPPHKKELEVTCAEHRYKMVCEAIKSNSYFKVSSIEVERPGYTYTIDTLNQLRSKFGAFKELFFIVGSDVILELVTWKQYEEVFKICSFIAVLRPGHTKSSLTDEINYLKKNYDAVIHVLETPLIQISSTDIRKRIKKGMTTKYLLPDGVEEYIYNNRLYK